MKVELKNYRMYHILISFTEQRGPKHCDPTGKNYDTEFKISEH